MTSHVSLLSACLSLPFKVKTTELLGAGYDVLTHPHQLPPFVFSQQPQIPLNDPKMAAPGCRATLWGGGEGVEESLFGDI